MIELFSGKIDKGFLEIRLRVAKVHFHIGLQPRWYLSAFQNLQNSLFSLVYQNVQKQTDQQAFLLAISKVFSFEQQIVLEAYENENQREREGQYDRVKTEIKNKILVISEELLALSEQTNAAVIVLVNDSLQEVQSVVRTGKDESELTTKAFLEIVTSMDESLKGTVEVDEKIKHLVEVIAEIGQATSRVTESAEMLNEASSSF